jgi:hypothetical protein
MRGNCIHDIEVCTMVRHARRPASGLSLGLCVLAALVALAASGNSYAQKIHSFTNSPSLLDEITDSADDLGEDAIKLSEEMDSITCVDEKAFRKFTKAASTMAGRLAVKEGLLEKTKELLQSSLPVPDRRARVSEEPDPALVEEIGFVSYEIDWLEEISNTLIKSLQRLKKCPPETVYSTSGVSQPSYTATQINEIGRGFRQETGWSFVLGGDVGAGQSWNQYEDFPRFDGDGWSLGGFAIARYHFPSGWFVGPEFGGSALHVNATNPDDAFSNIRSIVYEGGQLGYSFNKPGATPLNVYIGAAAAQANVNVGIDTRGQFESMSKTLDGWSAHTGFEVQLAPQSAPNWWLGFDYRYSHVSGDINGDPVSATLHLFSVTASYQFSLGH